MIIKKFREPNTYQVGDAVYAKQFPTVKLKVRRYLQRIYYCRVASNDALKEQVYFENELLTKEELKALNIPNPVS